MNKKVQQIKWLYISAFLLPVLAMAQEKDKERNIDECTSSNQLRHFSLNP